MTSEINLLVTCPTCKGDGKKRLSKQLYWCWGLLRCNGPMSAPELHQYAQQYDVTYFNHMIKRLIKAGLVKPKKKTRPVKYMAIGG